MLFVAGCFGVNIDTGTAETDKQSTISPQTVQRYRGTEGGDKGQDEDRQVGTTITLHRVKSCYY